MVTRRIEIKSGQLNENKKRKTTIPTKKKKYTACRSNIHPMLMLRLVMRFFLPSKNFMRITTTSPFDARVYLYIYTHRRWEWILFANVISLSFVHQLWFVDGLSVFCISYSDEQWTCATWSLTISSSSTHSLHFTPSQQPAAFATYPLYTLCLCIWIDSL